MDTASYASNIQLTSTFSSIQHNFKEIAYLIHSAACSCKCI